MPSKPRHLQNGRDLIYSLVPLLLISLILAGSARACSFSPGGPTAAAPPTIDAAATLKSAARTVDFPVRLPDLPPTWVSNSASSATVPGASGGATVGTGWISPAGRYLRLAQSAAGTDALVGDEAAGDRSPDGTVDAGGASWMVLTARNEEPVWVTDLGEVRVLITGSGSPEDFMTLAAATAGTAPLPDSLP